MGLKIKCLIIRLTPDQESWIKTWIFVNSLTGICKKCLEK